MRGFAGHRLRSYLGNSRQSGFTLLEALIALAILGFAFATTMAFHGALLGSAGENRLRSAAMSLAEAKIEQLRARPFTAPELTAGSTQETLTVDGFGLFGLRATSLNRCWSIADEPSLKGVQVSVSRASDACAHWSDTALVTLSSRIADNDFGRAGTKALADAFSDPDGFGEIFPADPEAPLYSGPPEFGEPDIPGGFEVVEKDEGFAVCDPLMQVCLAPTPEEDGSQNFATINGNIFISDRSCTLGSESVADRCEINLIAEGNAICRIHYPDDSLGGAPPALTASVGGDGSTMSYIRYTCVVADQWRRSIAIVPKATEKVCVGNPVLVQVEGDPSDQLRASSRFYDGRQQVTIDEDADEQLEIPHGIKGGPLTGDLQAKIGSMCMDGDPCWTDTTVRGLVPGGHHFLIMPQAAGTCSARMEALKTLDIMEETFFEHLFARNPDVFHCTSSKDYTGNFCLGYTRASGFIENLSSLALADSDLNIASTNSQLFNSCRFFGPLGQSGGGYVCALRHAAVNPTVSGSAQNQLIVFADPSSYAFTRAATDAGDDDYLPSALPLDATVRNFALIDAGEPPTAIISLPVVCDNLLCNFDGSDSRAEELDRTITEYFWDFGDGNFASSPTPAHFFPSEGTYLVSLFVTDSEGATGSTSIELAVTGIPPGDNSNPIAAFEYTCAGLECVFDAGNSSDPDGDPMSFTWQFSDGATQFGQQVTYTFGAFGTYDVTLIVSDGRGGSDQASDQVTLTAPQCNAVIVQFTRPNNNWSIKAGSYPSASSCSSQANTYTCSLGNLPLGTTFEVVLEHDPPGNNVKSEDTVKTGTLAACGTTVVLN